MLGAIAGDIIGSVYEWKAGWAEEKHPDFEPLFHPWARFTDDTVLTVAVADSILRGADLTDLLREYGRAYPKAGYGGRFLEWVHTDDRSPYNSWGNGSAMRVSPVAYAHEDLGGVIEHAARTAEATHNHPEGIRGAQATAAAIFLARKGESKDAIRAGIEGRFGYDLGARIDDLRPGFTFDVSCQGTVPPALIAFLESDSFEHAVRLAISLGGDADTLACIAGSVAQAHHGIPAPIREQALARLDDRLRGVVEAFEAKFGGL